MDDYEASGRKLQFEVMQAEATQLSKGDDAYTPREVAQATVHTRQDLVLVVSLLTQLNGHVRALRRLLLLALVMAAAVTAYRFFVR